MNKYSEYDIEMSPFFFKKKKRSKLEFEIFDVETGLWILAREHKNSRFVFP